MFLASARKSWQCVFVRKCIVLEMAWHSVLSAFFQIAVCHDSIVASLNSIEKTTPNLCTFLVLSYLTTGTYIYCVALQSVTCFPYSLLVKVTVR